ncbi:hypothetical protein Trydic_g21187 [Trypoxylus dichotomus]
MNTALVARRISSVRAGIMQALRFPILVMAGQRPTQEKPPTNPNLRFNFANTSEKEKWRLGDVRGIENLGEENVQKKRYDRLLGKLEKISPEKEMMEGKNTIRKKSENAD